MTEQWDSSERRELYSPIEHRMTAIEKEQIAFSLLLERNTEVLKEIHTALNKPLNIPAWAASIMVVTTVLGGLLYSSFIQPLDYRMLQVEQKVELRTKGT